MKIQNVPKTVMRMVSCLVLTAFVSTSIIPPAYAQAMPWMPEPGTMVMMSPAFVPAQLKGMVIDPNEPFRMDFIMDRGDAILSDLQKQEEYQKLIKYFLAALAVPDTEQWVNLSPYEKDRIIPDSFGVTEMGRDLLAQDYLLKQIASSLSNPDEALGKTFWTAVYAKAQEKFGMTDIPASTINKVWIVPDKADMYEKDNTVVIVDSHLKVMLEEDYLATQQSAITDPSSIPQADEMGQITSRIMREIIIPAIEKEVNEGQNFAPLRQVVSGMILATWYKMRLKESILGKVYADKARVKGIDLDPSVNKDIFNKYVDAFQKGVFNMIKEDVDFLTQEIIPRKYFSGGFTWNSAMSVMKFGDMPSGFFKSAWEVIRTLLRSSSEIQKAELSDEEAQEILGSLGQGIVLANVMDTDLREGLVRLAEFLSEQGWLAAAQELQVNGFAWDGKVGDGKTTVLEALARDISWGKANALSDAFDRLLKSSNAFSPTVVSSLNDAAKEFPVVTDYTQGSPYTAADAFLKAASDLYAESAMTNELSPERLSALRNIDIGKDYTPLHKTQFSRDFLNRVLREVTQSVVGGGEAFSRNDQAREIIAMIVIIQAAATSYDSEQALADIKRQKNFYFPGVPLTDDVLRTLMNKARTFAITVRSGDDLPDGITQEKVNKLQEAYIAERRRRDGQDGNRRYVLGEAINEMWKRNQGSDREDAEFFRANIGHFAVRGTGEGRSIEVAYLGTAVESAMAAEAVPEWARKQPEISINVLAKMAQMGLTGSRKDVVGQGQDLNALRELILQGNVSAIVNAMWNMPGDIAEKRSVITEALSQAVSVRETEDDRPAFVVFASRLLGQQKKHYEVVYDLQKLAAFMRPLFVADFLQKTKNVVIDTDVYTDLMLGTENRKKYRAAQVVQEIKEFLESQGWPQDPKPQAIEVPTPVQAIKNNLVQDIMRDIGVLDSVRGREIPIVLRSEYEFSPNEEDAFVAKILNEMTGRAIQVEPPFGPINEGFLSGTQKEFEEYVKNELKKSKPLMDDYKDKLVEKINSKLQLKQKDVGKMTPEEIKVQNSTGRDQRVVLEMVERPLLFGFRRTSESAMADDRKVPESYGGIDLNRANLDMQIKRDGNGIVLPLDQQDLENIRIDGLVPVILNIQPASTLPLFSSLASGAGGGSA